MTARDASVTGARPSARPGGRRRARVLLVAHSCSPYRGSEHIVGWGRITQTVQYHDVWLICGPDSERDLQRYAAESGPVPGLHVHHLGEDPVERWIEERFPADQLDHNYLAYHLWHRRVYRAARALHAQRPFDLVHQVNTCGFREPGYLWRLDAPFMWGPVGGTQNVPWAFLRTLSRGDALREVVRSTLTVVQLRLSPRVRRAARRTTVLLTANSTGERDFAHSFGARPVRLLETGLREVPPLSAARTTEQPARPLRLLWSGRLIARKGLHLLIDALAQLPASVAWTLSILGDGPRRADWQAAVARRGLADRCEWLGQVPYAEAVAQYAHADAFVFTSLRDTSGNVMLEALAAGVPVICLDHQGARDIVTDASGVKIPVTSPEGVVRDLAAAVARLAGDRAYLAALRRGAHARAHDFLWASNGERMNYLYDLVLDNEPAHPLTGAHPPATPNGGGVAAPPGAYAVAARPAPPVTRGARGR